ncbi:7-dehydrocholesterol reductase [Phtheirospermum japonicum]|uniref:7-dehydrocholesterol reductase n=1 Tax=Phtheirospermum japonicum TaxID=374723 RepID=A0A830B1M4_9LAMI|nr:7-dehydrocholesterol reductase [Phtheirospermum japonicum]
MNQRRERERSALARLLDSERGLRRRSLIEDEEKWVQSQRRWYTMVHADGSVLQTWDYLRQNGLQGFIDIWPKPTATAWKIIACYGAFEAALQLWLPGKRVEGPISPAGNRPVYKANGVLSYIVTLVTYLGLWWFGIFNPTIVYDHLGEIFSALIFGSFVFCIFLYIKGMELYPRIGKNFDIKYETYGKVSDSMLVNTALMLVYVTKFFWWEAGYWNTMDIAHDRAGFYICWGCLVWVPSIYTSPGMYLVNHPVTLGVQIVASYTTTTGETKTSLLLTSGWWGLARHFHYVPEILGAFFWTVPALFNHFLPYFYVIFLTILLFDRAKRDDDRCKSKYGKYWKLYCEKVPYRVVPGIY